jgi:large subunit ribosomal protein L20
MPRVKRGTIHVKKRRKLHQKTKGYKWGRKNLIRAAKIAVTKAGVHSYVGRKKKKRTARALWQIRISAFAKENELSYSKLMGMIKKEGISLDRKILADLAANNPEVFKRILEQLNK